MEKQFMIKGAQKMALLLGVVGCLANIAPLMAQTVKVRGSIGKALNPGDSTQVIVYGQPSTNLNGVVFENINICVSIPDLGAANPQVTIAQNYIPSLNWLPAGSNPEVSGGRAYYTFIGVDNESHATVSWQAGKENRVVALQFSHGIGRSFVQLNDRTDAGGIGSGGGANRQSFWYIQVNGMGDITDYELKFFHSPYSRPPVNGGNAAPSSVETSEEVALPASVGPERTRWRLFPNPTSERLYLECDFSGLTHIRIYDAWGRQVWEQFYTLSAHDQIVIHPGSLTAGVYILDVRAVGGQPLFQERFMMLNK